MAHPNTYANPKSALLDNDLYKGLHENSVVIPTTNPALSFFRQLTPAWYMMDEMVRGLRMSIRRSEPANAVFCACQIFATNAPVFYARFAMDHICMAFVEDIGLAAPLTGTNLARRLDKLRLSESKRKDDKESEAPAYQQEWFHEMTYQIYRAALKASMAPKSRLVFDATVVAAFTMKELVTRLQLPKKENPDQLLVRFKQILTEASKSLAIGKHEGERSALQFAIVIAYLWDRDISWRSRAWKALAEHATNLQDILVTSIIDACKTASDTKVARANTHLWWMMAVLACIRVRKTAQKEIIDPFAQSTVNGEDEEEASDANSDTEELSRLDKKSPQAILTQEAQTACETSINSAGDLTLDGSGVTVEAMRSARTVTVTNEWLDRHTHRGLGKSTFNFLPNILPVKESGYASEIAKSHGTGVKTARGDDHYRTMTVVIRNLDHVKTPSFAANPYGAQAISLMKGRQDSMNNESFMNDIIPWLAATFNIVSVPRQASAPVVDDEHKTKKDADPKPGSKRKQPSTESDNEKPSKVTAKPTTEAKAKPATEAKAKSATESVKAKAKPATESAKTTAAKPKATTTKAAKTATTAKKRKRAAAEEAETEHADEDSAATEDEGDKEKQIRNRARLAWSRKERTKVADYSIASVPLINFPPAMEELLEVAPVMKKPAGTAKVLVCLLDVSKIDKYHSRGVKSIVVKGPYKRQAGNDSGALRKLRLMIKRQKEMSDPKIFGKFINTPTLQLRHVKSDPEFVTYVEFESLVTTVPSEWVSSTDREEVKIAGDLQKRHVIDLSNQLDTLGCSLVSDMKDWHTIEKGEIFVQVVLALYIRQCTDPAVGDSHLGNLIYVKSQDPKKLSKVYSIDMEETRSAPPNGDKFWNTMFNRAPTGPVQQMFYEGYKLHGTKLKERFKAMVNHLTSINGFKDRVKKENPHLFGLLFENEISEDTFLPTAKSGSRRRGGGGGGSSTQDKDKSVHTKDENGAHMAQPQDEDDAGTSTVVAAPQDEEDSVKPDDGTAETVSATTADDTAEAAEDGATQVAESLDSEQKNAADENGEAVVHTAEENGVEGEEQAEAGSETVGGAEQDVTDDAPTNVDQDVTDIQTPAAEGEVTDVQTPADQDATDAAATTEDQDVTDAVATTEDQDDMDSATAAAGQDTATGDQDVTDTTTDVGLAQAMEDADSEPAPENGADSHQTEVESAPATDDTIPGYDNDDSNLDTAQHTATSATADTAAVEESNNNNDVDMTEQPEAAEQPTEAAPATTEEENSTETVPATAEEENDADLNDVEQLPPIPADDVDESILPAFPSDDVDATQDPNAGMY